MRDEPPRSLAVQGEMIRPYAALGACLLATLLRAETPELLQDAVTNWTSGKEELAFTQRARTLNDDGTVKEERLERYDPSLPDNRRWHLLEVNGQPPTDDQRNSIEVRRNRKPRKHANKPVDKVLDLSEAVVREQSEKEVIFEVGVRPDAARLFQTDKLILLVTVDRHNRTIERVTAGLREPMRVALGLAKVTDVDFDLTFDGVDAHGKRNDPDDEPNGTAKVSFSKLGTQMQYEWSDFKRVDAYRPNP